MWGYNAELGNGRQAERSGKDTGVLSRKHYLCGSCLEPGISLQTYNTHLYTLIPDPHCAQMALDSSSQDLLCLAGH